MKKVASVLLGLIMLASTSFGQAKQETKKSTTTTTTQSVTKTKKDGTPDKRYKENKKTSSEVILKKDGTPDKRYKKKGQ